MKAAHTSYSAIRFHRTFELIVEGIGHLFWPRVCANCGSPVLKNDDGLCPQCWERIQSCVSGDYCRRCGMDASLYANIHGTCAACEKLTLQYDGIARAGEYKDAFRDLILSLKFNDSPEFSRYLGPLADAALASSGFVDRIDMYVPVPLHWRRRLWRGFNQSMLLCKHLTAPGKIINTDLVRIRNTHRQWNLSNPHRRKNVAGAFAVRPDHNFYGKTICLVDDITTSGATLNECAKTLKAAGAAKVFALVVAVAANDT